MTITEHQAQALANLLHEIRTDWPTASLMTLLEKNQHQSFPELCKAAIHVANDHTKRTPAIIFMDGPHWDRPAGQPGQTQQFLTSSEKRRLQNAQLMGYYAAEEGTNPTEAFKLIFDPGDLNPAATLAAFQRGQVMATGTGRQAGALAIDTSSLSPPNQDVIDEGETL